ncbi:hypothetical protein ACFE04_002601 [Oxalis oulophora]
MMMIDVKAVKCKILGGSVARRVLLRAFLIVSTVSFLSLMHVLSGYHNSNEMLFNCGGDLVSSNRLWMPILGSIMHKDYTNLTTIVARELISMHLLSSSDKALCVGEGSAAAAAVLREMGFSKACGIYRHPFFSLNQKKFIYELDYADNSFDFVFSRDLEKVTVPALLVLEIERVLSPGGIGAMLVGNGGWNPNGLIKSATPVSSLLKSSNVVHVGYVSEFTLVVFKKNIETGCFEQYNLPADCPSITNGKQYLDNIEPLVAEKPSDFEKKIAYLPKLIDVASKKRLVYVDIGAGKHMNNSSPTTNWFLPSYPLDHNAFNIYFVDHNTSVLLSYVKRPGITFVYHPALAGNIARLNSDPDDDLDPYVAVGGFDFLAWFKETVRYSDFVVLKIGSGEVELKFLSDLFMSGAICFVDELFLRCSDHEDDSTGDCMYLFRSLRNSGLKKFPGEFAQLELSYGSSPDEIFRKFPVFKNSVKFDPDFNWN